MSPRSFLSVAALASFSLLVAGGFLLNTPQADAQDPGHVIVGPPCGDLTMEPAVIFEQSGVGAFGTVHFSYSVYNNGLVSVSRMHQGPTEFAPTSKATFLFVPPTAVRQFTTDLANAGAFGLCDEPILTLFVLPTTVTVFRGKADATAHTFSFSHGFGAWTGAAKVLSDFQAAWFADF